MKVAGYELGVFVFGAILAAALLTLVGFFFFALDRSIKADGRIDYCYVEEHRERTPVTYELEGHREWRIDRDLASFDSMEKAVDAATKYGCQVK